jgi:hypothetical protein
MALEHVDQAGQEHNKAPSSANKDSRSRVTGTAWGSAIQHAVETVVR